MPRRLINLEDLALSQNMTYFVCCATYIYIYIY